MEEEEADAPQRKFLRETLFRSQKVKAEEVMVQVPLMEICVGEMRDVMERLMGLVVGLRGVSIWHQGL